MDKPSVVIPVPKKAAIEPNAWAWPVRFNVAGDRPSSAAAFDQQDVDIAGGAGDALPLQLVQSQSRPEGYRLEFSAERLVVSAGDAAGFRHAAITLEALKSEGVWPIGTIDDWPDLSMRGFHINLEDCRRINTDGVLHLIRTAARAKLNTILLEYGSRFPIASHAAIRDPAALSPDDVDRIVRCATERGIRIIPLQQSLAHMEYALRHDAFAHLRERADRDSLMCPSNPESLALFKTLAGEIMDRHPDSDWFHIGGDEARKIGQCATCAEVVRQRGVGGLYGQYIGAAARWVIERGKRPIVWDDTLCAHPDAFEQLPPETIIAYWDYIAVADPTPVLIPRMSHACGGPRVAHDWSWVVRPKRGRVSDVQADVMRSYSKPVRLRSSLGAAYMNEFGPFLGDRFPKWIRALPYIEYYQRRGHDVLTCPTGLGNGDTSDGMPNFARFERNIRTHCARGKANGRSLGILTTAWYNVPPELLYQSLLLTAQYAW